MVFTKNQMYIKRKTYILLSQMSVFSWEILRENVNWNIEVKQLQPSYIHGTIVQFLIINSILGLADKIIIAKNKITWDNRFCMPKDFDTKPGHL